MTKKELLGVPPRCGKTISQSLCPDCKIPLIPIEETISQCPVCNKRILISQRRRKTNIKITVNADKELKKIKQIQTVLTNLTTPQGPIEGRSRVLIIGNYLWACSTRNNGESFCMKIKFKNTIIERMKKWIKNLH